MLIAIDFDGTIVDHLYPDVGDPVPGAIEWIKKFQEVGAKIILYTMRSDGGSDGDVLSDAVKFCEDNEIELYGVNKNPTQSSWTKSPKVYAHVYIDDAAFGCPLKDSLRSGGRPYVDWDEVGPKVMEMIK